MSRHVHLSKEEQKKVEAKEKIESKIWRQLFATASNTRKLEKTPYMQQHCKRVFRIKKKLGFAQLNYDNLI